MAPMVNEEPIVSLCACAATSMLLAPLKSDDQEHDQHRPVLDHVLGQVFNGTNSNDVATHAHNDTGATLQRIWQ